MASDDATPSKPTLRKPRATPERQQMARNAAPIDDADAEVKLSIEQGRKVDLLSAFPEPPPPIETQIEEGAVRPSLQEESLEEVYEQTEEIISRRKSNIPPMQEPPPPMPDPNMSPAQRLTGVATNASPYYAEYRLRLVHRMLMRNLPLDMISAQLQVDLPTLNKMRKELYSRLSYEAQTINRYEIAGKTMAFYDEVQGVALRMADEANAKPYVKLQALQTALSAQADRQRFLTASGFWSAAPYVPMDATEDESSRAAGRLHTLIEAIIDDKGEMQIDQAATDENIKQTEMDGNVKLL